MFFRNYMPSREKLATMLVPTRGRWSGALTTMPVRTRVCVCVWNGGGLVGSFVWDGPRLDQTWVA